MKVLFRAILKNSSENKRFPSHNQRINLTFISNIVVDGGIVSNTEGKVILILFRSETQVPS